MEHEVYNKVKTKNPSGDFLDRIFSVDPTGFEPVSPFAKDGVLPHELQARVHETMIKQKKPFFQGLRLFSKRVARNSLVIHTNTVL